MFGKQFTRWLDAYMNLCCTVTSQRVRAFVVYYFKNSLLYMSRSHSFSRYVLRGVKLFADSFHG